jgi:hypothetical protein
MRNPRTFAISLALALSALLATSSVAFAGTGSVNVLNVWGSAGAFGNYANFGAQYVATQVWSGTTQTWTIRNLEMTALIKGGRDCNPVYCSGWGFTGTAKFTDYTGGVKYSLTVPAGSCYAHATSPSDLLLVRCKAGTFTFSVSKPSVVTLTKMSLTWSVGLLVAGFFFFADAWHAAKSVTLNAT